jgi:hypothetical protein
MPGPRVSAYAATKPLMIDAVSADADPVSDYAGNRLQSVIDDEMTFGTKEARKSSRKTRDSEKATTVIERQPDATVSGDTVDKHPPGSSTRAAGMVGLRDWSWFTASNCQAACFM